MTLGEKMKLIKQAGNLYICGLKVEQFRKEICLLYKKDATVNSSHIQVALDRFKKANKEWKRLEREYLEYRSKLEKGGKI